MNTNQKSGDNSNQVVIHGDVSTLPSEQQIRTLALGFIATNFPLVEDALLKLRLNAIKFLEKLEEQISSMSEEERQKLSEPQILQALEKAIRSAAYSGNEEINSILGQLFAQILKSKNNQFFDMVISQSIEIAGKIDFNSIKILAILFILGQTRRHFLERSEFYSFLKGVAKEFADINITNARITFLQSVACLTVIPFIETNSIEFIDKNYRYLFLKDKFLLVPEEILKNYKMTDMLEKCKFISHSNWIAYLFLNRVLPGFNFSSSDKEKLKKLYLDNCCSMEEIKALLIENVPDYEKIMGIWDDNNLGNLLLTGVGTALGGAYVQKDGTGKINIEDWIN